MMECKVAQELLNAYIDGELAEAERDQLDDHLRSCPQCADELAELQAVIALCRNLPEVEPPAFFREQLYRRLTTELEQERKSLWQSVLTWARRRTYRSVTAALASVLILIFSVNGIVALQYNNPLFSLAGRGQPESEADEVGGGAPADAAKSGVLTFSGEKTPNDAAALTADQIETDQTSNADVDGGAGDMSITEFNRAPAVQPEDAATAQSDNLPVTEVPPEGRSSLGMLKAAAPTVTRGTRMAHQVRLVLAVDDLEASHNRVREITEANTGTVANITYRYGEGHQEEGRQISLQVPETLFAPVLMELEGLGLVTSKEMSEVNVTVQAMAVENRLSNINRQAETLTDLRNNSQDELRVVQIDNELNFIENEVSILQITADSLSNAQIELVLVLNTE